MPSGSETAMGADGGSLSLLRNLTTNRQEMDGEREEEGGGVSHVSVSFKPGAMEMLALN